MFPMVIIVNNTVFINSINGLVFVMGYQFVFYEGEPEISNNIYVIVYSSSRNK